MTWRAVTLLTLDDNFVTIPNATVSKAEIVNFHAPTMATARRVKVGVEYDIPPCDVQRVLKAAALETPGVVQKPEPDIRLTDFADSSIVYTVKFWIDQPARHDPIEQAVRVNIWYRLKQAGYGIPFPQQVQVNEKIPDQRLLAHRRAKAIDQVPLLAPLSFEQKLKIAEAARDLSLAPGQALFHQGDAGETFYVIYRGKVEVSIDINGQPKNRRHPRSRRFLRRDVRPHRPAAHRDHPRRRGLGPRGNRQGRPARHLRRRSVGARKNLRDHRPPQRRARSHRQGAAAAATTETVATAKQSLLGRMMKFFRLRS